MADTPQSSLVEIPVSDTTPIVSFNPSGLWAKVTGFGIKTFVKSWITKSDVGLNNVDNTSDLSKPISSATQSAINAKVGLTGDETIAGIKTFSSSPIVPTPTTDFQTATKKYVDDNSGGSGDVVGPISSTDNALARFDSTTGKIIQDGIVTESDTGTLAGVNSIQLNTTPTVTPSVGQLYWDATDGTVAISLDTTNNVTLALGTEQYIRIVNKTGVQINDGQVVYIDGAQGNRPTAVLAQANTLPTSKVIGVATQNIANNAEGFITTLGEVGSYNTSGFTAGDVLYLSPTVAGGLTNVAPTSPNFVVSVGVALNSTVNGKILVKTHQPLATSSTLVDNSDIVAPSQKAVKSYADTKALLAGSISQSFQASQLEVGHATDTTISRVSAGRIAVEGINVPTISSTDTLTNKTISGASNTLTVDGTNEVGFRIIPQNSQSANYTLVLTDSGKHIYHPSADTTARTWTIPANSSVAFPIGTAITFVNSISAGNITIAITTDTLRLAGAGTTGSRTLAPNGIATAMKVNTTEWYISGTNLT